MNRNLLPTVAGNSTSGVAGGSSLISLRVPTSPLVPILSRACSRRFSLFSMRAKTCRMASIFLSSRVYTNIKIKVCERLLEVAEAGDQQQRNRREQRASPLFFFSFGGGKGLTFLIYSTSSRLSFPTEFISHTNYKPLQ